MAPVRFKSLSTLEENSSDVFMESTEVLLKIARNILKEPSNPKYRSISIGSNVVTTKLLPAAGAMECLFEMGFQEGVDKLILPPETPLDIVKYIHDELLRRREEFKTEVSKPVVEKKQGGKKNQVDDLKNSLIKKGLTELYNQTTDEFLKKVLMWCFYVLEYENHDLQLKALKLIPIVELNLNVIKIIRKIQMEHKKKQISEENIDCQELLLIEVCNWFNTEFFTWVDTPECTKCGFKETTLTMRSETTIPGANRVEEYKCPKCGTKVLFPRYNDPDKLLETRRGRCGEWGNCFCLFMRALGWDARLVIDETDHVWVEVYSLLKSKWIHCDPCENAVDTPLMYECGWKKKLSYVIAYSKDEIQDVTWRYSCNHIAVRRNRNKCSEEDLVDFIIKVRNVMLSQATPARRDFVIKRTALELVMLMKQNKATESDTKGRISGSLAWRLLRGETTNESDFKPYVWTLEPEDEKRKKFVLSYITSKDQYFKHSEKVMENLTNGLYSLRSVFKKDEKDWKMTYWARREGSDRGIVSWKFYTGEKFSIGTVNLKLIRKTFETGIVSCKLCSGESCVLVPNDKDSFLTDAFMGSKTVELIVEMFGGSGNEAWQHAQILRQSLNSEETTFCMIINLVQL